jgi:hypothetical protein
MRTGSKFKLKFDNLYTHMSIFCYFFLIFFYYDISPIIPAANRFCMINTEHISFLQNHISSCQPLKRLIIWYRLLILILWNCWSLGKISLNCKSNCHSKQIYSSTQSYEWSSKWEILKDDISLVNVCIGISYRTIFAYSKWRIELHGEI